MSKEKSFKPDVKPVETAGGEASFGRTIRETVESVAIAFILAFMFRTFEAEAFVIPTGSMAPTLQGRHKDLACPNCGYWYRVNASNEIGLPGKETAKCTCPLCRYTIENVTEPSETSYSGDRILVAKFPFEILNNWLGEPKRWEVIVFKYPNNAKQNYIKRLIGLPGESIRIKNGDIYVRAEGEKDYHLERKPPHKVRPMLQLVYDNDYQDYQKDDPTKYGWPKRWAPHKTEPTEWRSDDGGKSFHISGEGKEQHWLSYHHFLPTAEAWASAITRKSVTPPTQAALIEDIYAYNSLQRVDGTIGESPDTRKNWVGDLAVEFDLRVDKSAGQVVFELVKGGHNFTCQLDLATGIATLAIDDGKNPPREKEPHFLSVKSKDKVITGPGNYHLTFANVDEQLLLWNGSSLVAFETETTYDSRDNYRPTDADRAPVGICAVEASVKVSGLKIWRDVYYTDQPHEFAGVELKKEKAQPFEDEFFALGDNSPSSADGRYWGTVPRKLLVGKALFIYWPHSFDRVPGTSIPFPFFPNFSRMGFVR